MLDEDMIKHWKLNVCVQDKCLDWFPRLRAISLAVEDVDGEQNEWKTLQGQVGGGGKMIVSCKSRTL